MTIIIFILLFSAAVAYQLLRWRFPAGMPGFWTTPLGRWLIGRIAGTIVFAALLQATLMVADRALVLMLYGYVLVFGFHYADVAVTVFLLACQIVAGPRRS